MEIWQIFDGVLVVAAVEVGVRNNGDEQRRMQLRMRRLGMKGKPVAIAREVEFGADLSQRLSEAVKKEAEKRNASEREQGERRIKKMIKDAEAGNAQNVV